MALNTTLEPWMRQLIPRLPGITEAEIESQLIYVIKDFCREGLPWQEMLRDYNVVAEDPVVRVNPIDSKRECVYVLNVYYEGNELAQVTRPEAVEDYQRPTKFTCNYSPDTITLIPTPDVSASGVVSVFAALAPKCPDKDLPEFFESHHFEAILDGVLGRMYHDPHKPYHDLDAAKYHLRRYRNKAREAASMAGRGYTPQAQNWAFPRFGV